MSSRVRSQPVEEVYDVAIIGGGVVGCAVARRFVLEGARVALLEKGKDILSGASKGNSAILHSGFDAPSNSLELQCIQEGNREYRAIRKRLNLPLFEIGAVLVAWDANQLQELEGIVGKARENGVHSVRRINCSEVKELMPSLGRGALGGISVPEEAIIDPWSAPLAYIQQAVRNGARLKVNCELLHGGYEHNCWRLETSDGEINAGTVINCAGLFGDLVDQELLGESDFHIRPRKGQFLVFDKAARRHVPRILLPVPTDVTKGILVAPTAFGNVLVGPTAEEQSDRNYARLDEAGMRRLKETAIRLVPALSDYPVTAAYAGLRPATNKRGFQVNSRPEKHWITIGGIRSTGLSAALGLASYVHELYRTAHANVPSSRLTDPAWPKVPNIAEGRLRDWETKGFDEIVCHCEWTTRREIERALTGLVPARSLSGLKRRTRATMGRCQGFYCSARIADLTKGRLKPSIAMEDIDD